jgi:transposase
MKNTKLNFTGQHLYVGIEVHKNNWSVTIIFMGRFLLTISMNPSPEELAKYLRKNYPGGIYHTVYEAGFCGYWIDRALRREGINNLLVNPADVPTSHKELRRKTDQIDSKKLARELSNNKLEGIYVPSVQSEALRSLNRLRAQITKDQTRIKNRIKSLLHFFGVSIPRNDETKHWSGKFIKYLTEIKFEHEAQKQTLNFLIESLKQTRARLVEILKSLRQKVKEDEAIKKIIGHLISVPGIGFITAITLYTELIDIKRFSKFDKLSAYVGFVPDTDSSGTIQKVTGISVRQSKYLRGLLIEAAWIAMRKDGALTMAYGQFRQRMNEQRAIVRIAKKLLSRIMYVWSNQKDYVCAVVK